MIGATGLIYFLMVSLTLHIITAIRPHHSNNSSPLMKLAANLDLPRNRPWIDCYARRDGHGRKISIGIEEISDLEDSPWYFDNQIESCVMHGIYIIYDGYNFNQNNLKVSVSIFMMM